MEDIKEEDYFKGGKYMNTLECIKKRRSIRSYTDAPLREQDLMEILEAGTYAPSAVNY